MTWLLAILAFIACLLGPAATPEPAPRPNIILITIEATRRDHCSLYGYERETTPFLEELAEESIVFDNGWSHSSWTYPSMASVFSGRLPHEHGVYHAYTAPTADVLPWLGSLHEAGYATGAFTTNRWVARLLGESTKFTACRAETTWRGNIECDARELLRRTLAWLDRSGSEPWFVFWHAFDPHAPYDAPGGMRDIFAGDYDGPMSRRELLPKYLNSRDQFSSEEADYLVARYDAEIRYTDAALRDFVQELRARGAWENTLLIVTADHGEASGGGKWGHGGPPLPATTAVPFLVRLPGGRRGGERSSDVVGGIDILPTLLEAAGLPVPDDLPGRNLVALLDAPQPEHVHYVQQTAVELVSEQENTYRVDSSGYALVRGTRFFRFVEYPDASTVEALHEVTLQGERQISDSSYDPWRQALGAQPAYPGFPAGGVFDSTQESAKEVLATLRDLGYL
ncbi:MAG: sulfatase [Candidatus Brocadiia bacterium]